jgi:hypothetical protein
MHGFRAALNRCGQDEPLLITWEEVAANPERVLSSLLPDDILRIDSPGADASAWACLAERGGGRLSGDYLAGRWQPGFHRFSGLAAVLKSVDEIVEKRGLRVLAHPQDILIMSDKDTCRKHLSQIGVRLPPALPDCANYTDFICAMAHQNWTRAFIKPRWGSSGAGIIAYQRSGWNTDAKEQAVTTLSHERVGGELQLFSTKSFHTVRDPNELHAMIDQILADGAVIERWIPKIAVAGGPVDLRFVSIAGRLRHRIARVGSGPITNLHLDARRLDVDKFMELASAEKRALIIETATSVAKAFPRSWYLGMDILVTHGFRDVLVCEANAWGDLLPGLEHEGEDTFTAEIRSLLEHRREVPLCAK